MYIYTVASLTRHLLTWITINVLTHIYIYISYVMCIAFENHRIYKVCSALNASSIHMYVYITVAMWFNATAFWFITSHRYFGFLFRFTTDETKAV